MGQMIIYQYVYGNDSVDFFLTVLKLRGENYQRNLREKEGGKALDHV